MSQNLPKECKCTVCKRRFWSSVPDNTSLCRWCGTAKRMRRCWRVTRGHRSEPNPSHSSVYALEDVAFYFQPFLHLISRETFTSLVYTEGDLRTEITAVDPPIDLADERTLRIFDELRADPGYTDTSIPTVRGSISKSHH